MANHASANPWHMIRADLPRVYKVFFVVAILISWKKMSRKYRQIKISHCKKDETVAKADASGSALFQGIFISTDKGLPGIFQSMVVTHIVSLTAVSLYGIKAFRIIRLQVIFRGLVWSSLLAEGNMSFQLGDGK